MSVPILTSWLLVLGVVGGASGTSLEPAGGEAKAIHHESTADTRHWQLELPGRLEASTVFCPPAGDQAPCELFLITRNLPAAPSGDAGDGDSTDEIKHSDRQLSRLRLDADSELLTIAHMRARADEPSDRWFQSPQLSLLGGQTPSLLVIWRGRVHQLELEEALAGNPPRSLQELSDTIIELDDGAEWRSLGLLSEQDGVFAAADVGRLQLFGLDDRSPHDRVVKLPTGVGRRAVRLDLRAQKVAWLPTEPPVLAIGPESHGDLRLRTLLVDPVRGSTDLSDEENAEAISRWSMLPGFERVIAAEVWAPDGRPMLAVATLQSDRVGFLERKKVRLFDLESDRSRVGSSPFFEVLTSSRLWQDLTVDVVKRSRDSDVTDLVLVQPEGLGGNKLVVDRYVGADTEAGGAPFSTRRQRVTVKVPWSWWSYGEDWNADGLPDLLHLQNPGVLRLFPGRTPESKTFLDRNAKWEREIGILARHAARDAGEGDEDEPTPQRQAILEDGILLVRLAFPDAQDQLEVITPSKRAPSLVVANLTSSGFAEE